MSLLSLALTYLTNEDPAWNMMFAGDRDAAYRGAAIEFGRQLILLPLVFSLMLLRFPNQCKILFFEWGASKKRQPYRVLVFRALLVIAISAVLWRETAYHFMGGGLENFGSVIEQFNQSEQFERDESDILVFNRQAIRLKYYAYYAQSLILYFFIAIPLIICPLYAVFVDVPIVIDSHRRVLNSMGRKEVSWDEFAKYFAQYKSRLLSIALRYVEVLAIVAISIVYELSIGFTTLTDTAKTNACFWWMFVSISGLVPSISWTLFGDAYYRVLVTRGDQLNAEWSQGNNCQNFVISLFTASPGGVVALLLGVSLLQLALHHHLY